MLLCVVDVPVLLAKLAQAKYLRGLRQTYLVPRNSFPLSTSTHFKDGQNEVRVTVILALS